MSWSLPNFMSWIYKKIVLILDKWYMCLGMKSLLRASYHVMMESETVISEKILGSSERKMLYSRKLYLVS